MKKTGIAIVIGTKAELIKCMPIMLELQKQKKNYWFIHTGQHPLGKAAEEFGVKRPDFTLSAEPKISTKFWSKLNRNSFTWFIKMIFKVKKTLKRIKPDYVVYHGDTMSTSAAAIGSSKLLNFNKKWKNVHLEAGLRSGSLLEPFPEEISRQISDRFSDILLAVSDRSERNLSKYKKNKKVIKVGNTIVDSAAITYNKSKQRNKKLRHEYALINIHRHENLKNKKRLRKVVAILKSVKIQAIWPIHDNTKRYLEEYGLMKEVEGMRNIMIVPLTEYERFIFMLANCKYLITDGGSIQEESLIFGKPCIILRKRTERQEGLLTGINFLTGLRIGYARKMIDDIEKGGINIKKLVNPYGNKGVSKRIVEYLK